MLVRVFGIAALILANVAAASPEFVPLQDQAQGQSLAGANLLNDSLYANPAASSFVHVYSMDGTFEFPKSMAFSILDTRTSNIGGSLGYFREGVDGTQQTLQGVKGAFSGRIADNIGFGLAGKLLWGPDSLLPPTAPNTDFGRDKLTDMDLGLLADFKVVQVGGTVRNVFGGDYLMGLDREFDLGGRINYQQILFLSAAAESKMGGDPLYHGPSVYQYGVGAEFVSPYYLSFKGGYRIQPAAQLSWWSTGVSFVSPKLSIHYAVEIPVGHSDQTEHMIGTTLLF